LGKPDWSYSSHSLALGGDLPRTGLRFHLIVNAYWQRLEFELPALDGAAWRRWIDTALRSPDDIVPWQQARSFTAGTYPAAPRSVVVLVAAVHSPSA